MEKQLPSIIVSGASGFIGSHFLNAAKEKFRIYAIARRSQEEAGIPLHENIKWFQGDISNWTSQKKLMIKIEMEGGADYIYHLAGYYDFTMKEKQEYNLTNVIGTRHMLEMAKALNVKRFFFAGSLASCSFPPRGAEWRITEKTPADAKFPYAVSKHMGEEIVREYSATVPSLVFRFPVIFSDWCQYEPLYRFLATWLSRKWNSRILGGRGHSAVTYLHTDELNRFVFTIIEKQASLPSFDVLIPSPDGSTTHRELFEAATNYYYGKKKMPILVPRLLAYPGVLVREIFGRLTNHPPFEQLWMLKLLDLRLDIDASYTRKVTGWEPLPRYHILRRMLYMIDKIKNQYDLWVSRNQFAYREFSLRSNMLISGEMAILKDELQEKVFRRMMTRENEERFCFCHVVTEEELRSEISTCYDLIMTTVQVRDRMILVDHLFDICARNYESGLGLDEIRNVLMTFNEIIAGELIGRPAMHDLGQEIHDQITVMLFVVASEMEDIYEKLLTV